jgi:hypothetical protein
VARKTVVVSDLTGKQVDEKNAAQVVIKYADARRGQVVLDVNSDEVDNLARRARNRRAEGVGPRSHPLRVSIDRFDRAAADALG